MDEYIICTLMAWSALQKNNTAESTKSTSWLSLSVLFSLQQSIFFHSYNRKLPFSPATVRGLDNLDNSCLPLCQVHRSYQPDSNIIINSMNHVCANQHQQTVNLSQYTKSSCTAHKLVYMYIVIPVCMTINEQTYMITT